MRIHRREKMVLCAPDSLKSGSKYCGDLHQALPTFRLQERRSAEKVRPKKKRGSGARIESPIFRQEHFKRFILKLTYSCLNLKKSVTYIYNNKKLIIESKSTIYVKNYDGKNRIKLIIELCIKPNGWSSDDIVFIIQDLLKILTNYKAIRYAFWVPLEFRYLKKNSDDKNNKPHKIATLIRHS